MIHEIAISDSNTVNEMQKLQKDIKIYNPRLRLAILSK